MRVATPAGIGAFLAHLGLQSAEGIGAVVGDIATAVTLGGCPPEQQTKLVAYVTMPVHLTAPVSKATNTLAMYGRFYNPGFFNKRK